MNKIFLVFLVLIVALAGCGKKSPGTVESKAFIDALSEGNLGVAVNMLENFNNNQLVNTPVEGGNKKTPLMFAVLSMDNTKELVQLLIEHGADVKAKDEDGETALHYAVVRDADAVKVLLDNGADLKAENNAGKTPIDYANEGRSKNVIDIINTHLGVTPKKEETTSSDDDLEKLGPTKTYQVYKIKTVMYAPDTNGNRDKGIWCFDRDGYAHGYKATDAVYAWVDAHTGDSCEVSVRNEDDYPGEACAINGEIPSAP